MRQALSDADLDRPSSYRFSVFATGAELDVDAIAAAHDPTARERLDRRDATRGLQAIAVLPGPSALCRWRLVAGRIA
jgi:hypothetical protein